jgi:beta-glucosidase
MMHLALAIGILAATPIDQRVEDLLAQMTLEEKLGQLIQHTGGHPDLKSLAEKGGVGCIFNVTGAATTNELQRAAMEKSRLKIPILFAHDVIHGHRTIFPIPLGMASSWDPATAELEARVAAREASATGIRWTFAPMVDIARDPRWGRIAEGAGEDPLLGAAMAAAYVRGFQGSDLSAPDSILACAKHFAAYGAAESGRDYNTVDMSEARLREVYLPPFKAAVDAGVATIMTSFNALNGVPASANEYLLETVLRGEWGFKGFVDSDYTAIAEMVKHGVAANAQEAALKAITAGVDMDMVDGSYMTLGELVASGRLPQSVVDEAVRRVLRAKFALGLFERPYTDEKREPSVLLSKENLDAARRVAEKSIILLKNEKSLLPLSKDLQTIALIGPLADSKADMLGNWFAIGKAEEAVTVLEGVRGKVNQNTRLLYARGEEIATAVASTERSDVAILILGEEGGMSGEAASRAFLDLPGKQQQLLEAVVATGKPVVLVVMAGRPLTIRWAAENVPVIVWAWYPGTQGGHAIANILFGEVNPSAKLPVTIPRAVGQIPIHYAVLPTGRPENPSDKYTSKYLDVPNTPLYPFGHGLSYTQFEYAGLQTSVSGSTVTVSADVRNAGQRAGEEIVQLYVHDPVASVSRPVRELKGFRRVSLGPGETKRVEFTLTRDDLRFWSGGGWKFEGGRFNAWIAPSSTGGVAGTFDLP